MAARRAQELRADLTSRGVHPDVLVFCKAELVADDYFHAVLEASKSIFDKLRVRTGLTEDGGALVDKALSGTPRNSPSTRSPLRARRANRRALPTCSRAPTACSATQRPTKHAFTGP